MRSLLLATMLLSVVGCARIQDRHYSVTITNQTHGPLTLGLVKNGPVYQDAWRPPEADAIAVPGGRYRPWGVILPPGRTGDLGAQGKFHPGTVAILRVYDGQLSSTDLLAISSDDPARLDVPLEPGPNVVTITIAHGRLIATFSRPSAATPFLRPVNAAPSDTSLDKPVTAPATSPAAPPDVDRPH